MTDDDDSIEEQPRQRRTFKSSHRAIIDHIAIDAAKATPYGVNLPTLEKSSACVKATDALKKSVLSTTLESLLPCTRWLKSYDWKLNLPKDLIAGCTVGVMIVPQSMSYAKLAGLPVEYGLYSALVPIFAYGVFGSSRQLAVGPVALISLLLSTGLTEVLAKQGLSIDDPKYQSTFNTLAVQTSFLVGIVNIAMGLLRLGFVTIFLSHAVISGFTTGAAVIIGMSQVKYLFGYDISSKRLHQVISAMIDGIEDFNWKTFLMGSISIVLMMGMKNLGKMERFKYMRALGPLTVTTLAILCSIIFDLESYGIPLVGDIPKGLPSVTISSWFPMDSFGDLIIIVISIVIVGFMESIAIAKTLASKHKYEIDSSQELIGLGMANFLGGAFQSYPITGSFSRSAVNNSAGAISGISGMITASMVGLVLLLLTPVFELLPLNTLAAIVISGVIGLLDYPEAISLWKIHKFDFGVWSIACAGTMFLGVEIGLAIAVGVSLLIVVYEAAYPHTSVLGRLPGTSVYRNVKQYMSAETYDGIVVVRIEAPLFFANMQNVRDKIRKYRLVAAKQSDVKYIVLELSPVGRLDTSALHILKDMYETYQERDQQIVFCNPNLAVMAILTESGFVDLAGKQHFFASVSDAVSWCLHELDVMAVSRHESTVVNANTLLSSSDVEAGDNSSSSGE